MADGDGYSRPERGDWARKPLSHTPEAPAVARHIAEMVLNEWHVDAATADAVLLVTSELVTNAVTHAEPPVVLSLCLQHHGWSVWVGVTDGGPAREGGSDSRTEARAEDEHGRGLYIVDALADARGTLSHVVAVTHWARLAVGPDAG
ncbi:ATP-binding protein [Streptomyces sp. NPDC057675]|uniref:ATP-binding protein n=1 Tax=Streptomyces sp. NPDC057675 TaxID=3346204 RepID=UPI0036D02419